MTEVSVSVRDLVAFCHRAGDIDHRFTPSPTAEEGTEGHQKIYRRRPASYLREHPVEYRHRQGDIQRGRLFRQAGHGHHLAGIDDDETGAGGEFGAGDSDLETPWEAGDLRVISQ